MKKVYICLIMICCLLPLFSQQKIDVNINQQPISNLFDLIEQKTDYKIYCNIQELDTLNISVIATDIEPIAALQSALSNTTFKVSKYNNNLFILDEVIIATSLPTSFTKGQKVTASVLDSLDMGSFLLEEDENLKATSEHRLYEVGNPALQPPRGKVMLTGYIYDSKTGEPASGVSVYTDVRNATFTDAFGYYALGLSPGRHEINISGGGQKPAKRLIQIYSDGRLDIQTIEKVHTLQEVLVKGDRTDNVKQITLGVERLKMQDIKNIPTVFGEADILKIVMTLPGVKSVGEISSGFNVRGGATDQNLILYNDATIYNPTHLFGMFSAFNPDIVKDLELYKSSIPSKYGGRISSVLNINGKEGNKKEFQGAGSIGLLTSRLTFEGPIIKDKTSIIFGGRTTYSDWLLSLLPEKSGYKDGRAGFFDLNTTISHTFDERNNLYVNGYYSSDRFRFEGTEKYKYKNANASIKWRHVFSPKVTGTFTAGYDHYNYDIKNTADSITAYNTSFAINQFFGKADMSWYLSDKHTAYFGLSTIHYNLNPGTLKPEGHASQIAYDQIQHEKSLESAIYLGDQWDITSQFSIDLGIRYSMFNVLGTRNYNIYNSDVLPSMNTIKETVTDASGVLKTYHGPEFRASLRYSFTDDFSVKAGVNSMRQYIHKISNTSIMAPTDTWKLSDVNIKPQKGIQYAIGFYKNFQNDMYETSIETYYKTMDDYLDYRAGAQIQMNHNLETDVLSTSGRAYGIELMVKKSRGKLNGWFSYTYSRTELKQDDPRIALPVNEGGWYPADYDKPHEFKFIGNYKFTHRYSLSLNCEYATGRPITLPLSKYEYAGGEFAYYSDRNQYRIPDYFRIDLGFNIEAHHHLTSKSHSSWSFGVYNITGRKNAHSVYYKRDGEKLKGYKLAIFGAPIPYVAYNVKF